jgi:predicted GIY-YIG superfamily endonuclease
MFTHAVYWIRLNSHDDINSEGYVGVSSDFEARMKAHEKFGAGMLENVKKKYGWSSLVKEIYFIGTVEDCYDLERILRPRDRIGWNINQGGHGGFEYINNNGLSTPFVSEACREGLAEWHKTEEGMAFTKSQGDWLAENYPHRNNSEYQRQQSAIFWDAYRAGLREHPTKDKVYTTEEKLKTYPKATCPSCGKTGNARGIKQWHGVDGSKCKHKQTQK